MHRGYVKIYRKLLDSRIWQNEGLLKVWLWCLLKATHEERWVSMKVGTGDTEVKLQPGQFIFGRKAASKELHIPRSTVWKRMLKLENMQNLNMQRNSKYSIINITNWDSYQGEKEKRNSQKDKQGTAREQPGNTNKNVKNVEHVENKEIYIRQELIPFDEIISYLNKKTGKNFSPKSKETQRLIRARCNQGFQLSDFIQVIDKKCAKWLTDPKMIDYLRPQTLFGTKFEAYLNETTHILQGKVSDTTLRNIQNLNEWRPPNEG